MTLPGRPARFANGPVDAGVRYLGPCCGSVAEHVKAMALELGKLSPHEREWRSTSGRAMSAYEYYERDESAPRR